MKFEIEPFPHPPPLITVVSHERLDQGLFYQTFPFEDPVTVIEIGSEESVEQTIPTLSETEILVVSTQYPEEDRLSMEALSGAAENAFPKILFTPREVPVEGFTNQVYFSEGSVSLSAQLGRFLGLIVGSYHKGGSICISIEDLVRLCKIANFHYRFYPYREGSLVQFSKECLLKLEEERIKKSNLCFVILFGHDLALMEELSEISHLFWGWVDRSNDFRYNFFIVGEEHRGMSVLIA